ncbi:uncharacterized protein C6orf203 homolog [Sipha flava]|uniref:Uncharacterized protein C6orf203 homolog n=1 Tax=Sipha flava TaxID=143950 RepID=A0A2S2R7F8_9HEMI|nr:uncharacterized protein C6orf203 homolog [Sipha flava]
MSRFVSGLRSAVAVCNLFPRLPSSVFIVTRSVHYHHHQCRRPPILANTVRCLLSSKRYKRTKNQNDDDSSDDEELDLDMDNSSKLMKFRTSTMRMDAILKHALGKSRNKIEVAFYESRIRVNGEKVTKKSHSVEVGDEIDLVKGPSPNNPDFLLVSRVEVLSAKLDGDELEVKLKMYKNLLINDYDNKWKSPS